MQKVLIDLCRHPSYTGMYLIYLGIGIWTAGNGSWMRESGVLDTWLGRGFVASFAAYAMTLGLCSFISYGL